MTKVRMEHPDLPGQAIYVRPTAVLANARAGWREAPEPEPVPPAERPGKSRRGRISATTQEESHGADAASGD